MVNHKPNRRHRLSKGEISILCVFIIAAVAAVASVLIRKSGGSTDQQHDSTVVEAMQPRQQQKIYVKEVKKTTRDLKKSGTSEPDGRLKTARKDSTLTHKNKKAKESRTPRTRDYTVAD